MKAENASDVMAYYAQNDFPGRAWSVHTQLHLALTFINSGKTGMAAFIRHLNEFIDEERSVVNEEVGNDYPMYSETLSDEPPKKHVQPRLEATFRPQQWVGEDHLCDLFDQKVNFDATDVFLKLSLEQIKGFKENDYDSDDLAEDLPERQEHNGPFEVDVDINVWLYENGIEDRAAMTQEQLDQLREKYNVKVD